MKVQNGVSPSITDIQHFHDHPPSIARLNQKSSILDLNSNHAVSPMCRYETTMSVYMPYELNAITI